jgi:hypothetical protein
VIGFIQDHIIYRFGLPETITTDQGTVFVGQKMQNFANEAGFKLLTSKPYQHRHWNDQPGDRHQKSKSS